MIERVLISVLLIQPALAQVISGSIVVINLTKNQLTVAADSINFRQRNLTPTRDACKISTFDDKIVFAQTGSTRSEPWDIRDPRGEWDNLQTVRSVLQSGDQISPGGSHLRAVAESWAFRTSIIWKKYYGYQPTDLERIIERWGPAITCGMFFEVENNAISFWVAQISFDKSSADALSPIKREVGIFANSWECGGNSRIYASGLHMDAIAAFCAKRSSERRTKRIKVNTPLVEATEDVKLPVKIVETIVAQYGKEPGDVDVPVDAVTLKSDGSITWNALKPNCPKKQD